MKLLTFKSLALTLLLSVSCATKNEPAMTPEFNGIDVSHHQGRIDWRTVAESYANIEFVYIKGTEGATYIDPRCLHNAREAKKNGLQIGIYHYFRMTSTPEAQFENYKHVMELAKPDLIPMVDVETADGHSAEEAKRNLRKFLALVKKEYGVEPMIYGTMRSYNSLCAPDFNDHILYIARYGKERPVIKGPYHYDIWQYTDKASLKGIEKPVDLCRFHQDCDIRSLTCPSPSRSE